MEFGRIPSELAERDQWILLGGVHLVDGSRERRLFRPHAPSDEATVEDAATWGTFERAVYQVTHGGAGSLAFVLSSDDPFAAVELRRCRRGDELEPWAATIVEELDSYTEATSDGVQVIVRATLGDHSDSVAKARWTPYAGRIDIFGAGRYLVLTGNPAREGPAAIQARQEALNRVIQAAFPQEWHGGDEHTGRAVEVAPEAPSVLQALGPDIRRLETLRAAREPLDPVLALRLSPLLREAQDALGRLGDALEPL